MSLEVDTRHANVAGILPGRALGWPSNTPIRLDQLGRADPGHLQHQRHGFLADTIIGPGLVIDGNLESESSVRIDGEVRGRVTTSGNLELGPKSAVRSDVNANRVSVAGAVLGNVVAKERVDLLAGARLTGDVRAARLTIADGAAFRGKVEMEGDGD